MASLSKRGRAGVAVTNAVAGTLKECFHAYSGVATYVAPVVLRSAREPPLIFGLAT